MNKKAAIGFAVVAGIGVGAALLISKAAAAPPPPEEYTVSGRVIDALTAAPLEGVSVSVNGEVKATSNMEGLFSFKTLPNAYTLTYSKTGYQTATQHITVTKTIWLGDIPLLPIYIPPPGLPVEITDAKTTDSAGNLKTIFRRGETVVLTATYKNVSTETLRLRLSVQVLDPYLFPYPPGITEVTLNPNQTATPAWSLIIPLTANIGVYTAEFNAFKNLTPVAAPVRIYFEVVEGMSKTRRRVH